jgi:hypothetical protein
VKDWKDVGIKEAFTPRRSVGTCRTCTAVDTVPQLLRTISPSLYACFPHHEVTVLNIELLPDFGDLFADQIVELDGFFNLLYGMDGRGMILAAKFIGDARKAKVKFTTQKVHGDLARYYDMLVAFRAADFPRVELEVSGGFVDDLFRGEVLGAGVADIAK